MLTVEAMVGAPLQTNCYLVADARAGQACLIDAPLQVVNRAMERAEALSVVITTIVCTHGHWDHTLGLPELVAATGAFVACHEQDAPLLMHPSFEPFSFDYPLTPVVPDQLLTERTPVQVGEHALAVLYTPGHTPGGICLYVAEEGLLFSGDTLFAGSYGRTDLAGGNAEALVASLMRLAALPAETRVYPGHGPDTTIGRQSWLAHVDQLDW